MIRDLYIISTHALHNVQMYDIHNKKHGKLNLVQSKSKSSIALFKIYVLSTSFGTVTISSNISFLVGCS